MTNQINREYVVVTSEGEVMEFFDTRQDARTSVKANGGRRAGYKILQQFVISREIR